jgi:hypothetical protein
MAYSLPLYLHINEHGDNDNLLSLWWYISTTRHLGIGGVTPEEPKFALLRSALTLYHRYKSYFTRGKFYGFAYDTHVHVDRINHSAVVNTFNLSSEVIHKSIMVPHAKYGINAKNISAYDGVGLPVPVECRKTDVCFEITVSVNSLTPVLIVLD